MFTCKLTASSSPPLQLLQQLTLPPLQPLYFLLQLLVLSLGQAARGHASHVLLVADLPPLLLQVPQPALEVGVLCEEAAGDDFVLVAALLAVVEEDLLEVLQLALDEVVGLH